MGQLPISHLVDYFIIPTIWLDLGPRVWNDTGPGLCLKPKGLRSVRDMKNRCCRPPKLQGIYDLCSAGHKEHRDFPLWRANRCRTHFYLRRRKTGGWDRNIEAGEFWRNRKIWTGSKPTSTEWLQRQSTWRKMGGGGPSPPPFWKQRGRGERKSTPDRKRKCQGSKRKKNWDLNSSLSQVKDKILKQQQKKIHKEECDAPSMRLLDKTHRLHRDHVGAGYCGAHAPWA